MTSCVCCNRPFAEEWADNHDRCPLCITCGCTAVERNCPVPEPKQNPKETRELPEPDELDVNLDEGLSWSDFTENKSL